MTEMTNLNRTQDRKARSMNGGAMLVLVIALFGALFAAIAGLIATKEGYAPSSMTFTYIAAIIGSGFAITVLSFGFYQLQPNESAAITLFGNFKGADRNPGLRWVVPWYGRKKVSMRVRNVTSQTLKVNDRRGSPIEIAAVVVWRVVDVAQALYDVDNYETFVNIQIETALRDLASHFSYDQGEDHEPTLRSDTDQVRELLRNKLRERVAVAGVTVDQARLSHLAYAPEIASAMLRRQQAEAILAARQKIVAGAVSMVETALQELSSRDVVKLDDERRAAMVSNLLVVLCADHEAQPVINTGTLYN